MSYYGKPDYKRPLLVMLSFLVIGFFIGNYYSVSKVVEKEVIRYQAIPSSFSWQGAVNGESSATMRLPAVDINDSGVSASLTVKARPGTGMIFVSLNNVLSKYDTQQSVRMAAQVASKYAGADLSKVDLFYDLFANATMLEGPSAGAALSVATIAALGGKKIRDDVMITGTLNHDGTIGPAGRVIQKAKAAKKAGASLFLVPIGEKDQVDYDEGEHCETYGTMEYCEFELKPKKIDVGKEAGLEVIEVRDVGEAAEKFIIPSAE